LRGAKKMKKHISEIMMDFAKLKEEAKKQEAKNNGK